MRIDKFCKLCGIEYEKNSSEVVIFNNLLKRFMHIFQFENIDESINIRDLMLSIIFNDSYMIIEKDGVLRNVYGGYSGVLDFYGYPTRYLWSTGTNSGDESIEDGVVGHSNSLWTPLAPTLFYYSKLLANLDTSLKIASNNTRIVPVYPATTDSERKQIDEIFKDMEKGCMNYSVMHKKTLEELTSGEGRLPIDLTGKSGDSNYIPMILQAYDNVLARVCREIGINITNVMKKAQVISPEVNGYENYTQIFLDDMLENITDTFSKVNERWKKDWKVSLSNAFLDDNPSDERADKTADGNGGLNDTNVDEVERGIENENV